MLPKELGVYKMKVTDKHSRSEEVQKMEKLYKPTYCECCDHENKSGWCYEIYSKSSDERLYGCKREGKKLLDKGWEETGSTDSEDTPLLIYPPHKYKSEKGIHTYIYNSIETGEPIVKVVRTDDGEGNKSFAQYSKKNGNWLIGTRYIEKSDIALYNSESFHTTDTIFLVEGEKSVHVFKEIDLVATTIINGAKKSWNDKLTPLLKDKRVILVPDCDKVGVESMLYKEFILNQAGIQTDWLLPFSGSEIWKNYTNGGGVDVADWKVYSRNYEGIFTKEYILNSIGKNKSSVLSLNLQKSNKLKNSNTETDVEEGFILELLNDIFQDPVISFKENLYFWNGMYYERKEKDECRHIITRYQATTPIKRRVNGKWVLNRDIDPDLTTKLYNSALDNYFVNPSFVNTGGINCNNGVLVFDFVENKLETKLIPHNPEMLFTYGSKVNYNPNASKQNLNLLMRCLDRRQRNLFFEIAGVSLDIKMARTKMGRDIRAAIMKGIGSNGKDSLRSCLSIVFGGQISDVTLSDFSIYDNGRKFPLCRLKGSPVNWPSENKPTDISNLQSLKAAITGDNLSYEIKGKQEKPFTPNAVFFFNLNDTPDIGDNLEAIKSRFCIFDFKKTFVKNADSRLNELEADPRFRYDTDFLINDVCPAFLNEMIEGFDRSLRRGIDYKPLDQSMRDVQIESNHLVAFCDDTGLRYDPDGKVSTHEIFKRLQEWYVETGVVEYDEMNRQVWYPNKSRRDYNIKGLPHVKTRFSALFPKATITQSRTSSSRLTVFNGICFHDSDEVTSPSEPDSQTIMKTEDIATDNLAVPQPVSVGIKESPPTENSNVQSSSVEWEYVEHPSQDEVIDDEKQAIADIDIDVNKVELLAPAEEKVKYNPYQFAEIQKVKGKPTVVVDEEKIDIYNIPTPKRPIDFKPFKIPEYNELKLIYMDIETTGLNPDESEIISVGLMREENGKTENLIISRKDFDERSLISQTIQKLNILCNNGYSVLVGHNIFNFDLPFIASRAEKYGINVPYDIVKERFTNISSASMFGKPIQFHNIVWRGYKKLNIIDTMHQLGIYDKSANKLTNYKLKPSVIQLKLREDKRTELSYEEIMESYKTGNWGLIDEYLIYDLEDTKLLTDFLLPQVYYQLQIVPGLTLQALAVASPALKWEKILENHYYDVEMPQADVKCHYQGGLVSVNAGLYHNCAKIDVSGMYPSIQLNYDLCSSKDPNNFYLSVLEFAMKERMVLKAEYKKTGSLAANAKQNAYKILNNGGYGFTGTQNCAYNCMKTAALVTAYGRLIVQKMIDILLEENCEVIEVDTDGIYFSSNRQEEVYKIVQEKLPKGINIDLEHKGVDIYCPHMKNYIIYHDNKVTVKGAKFKSRAQCQLLKTFVPEYVKNMLESKDLANEYYEFIITSLKERTIDISLLKKRVRIAVNSKRLLPLGKVGETVEHYEGGVVTKRGAIKPQPITEGDYLIEYYVSEVNKLKNEVDNIIENRT